MREARIQQAIRLALGREEGLVAWRNNTGVLVDRRGQRVRYGLCRGSSDLVGVVTMPDGLGRFAAWEIKGPDGDLTEEQNQFLRLVRRLGGFGCEVRSVDDVLASVGRCRAGCDE